MVQRREALEGNQRAREDGWEYSSIAHIFHRVRATSRPAYGAFRALHYSSQSDQGVVTMENNCHSGKCHWVPPRTLMRGGVQGPRLIATPATISFPSKVVTMLRNVRHVRKKAYLRIHSASNYSCASLKDSDFSISQDPPQLPRLVEQL